MPSLAADGGGSELKALRLRGGTAEQAGLDAGELHLLIREVERLPEGERPWCSGAVLLAGRGPVIAVERAVGWALRYSAYDEERDRGVELPREQWVPMRSAAGRPGDSSPGEGGTGAGGLFDSTTGSAAGGDAGGTVFDLASLTKVFTAIAAVQQVERGALDLDHPVASYAPEYTAAAEHGITVRQLLTHTSGLRPDLPLYRYPTAEQRLARLTAEAPMDAPGSAYRYSDLNLLLLQRVLERLTGHSLAQLVRDGITRPLGMSDTRYAPPAGWRPRIAATEDQRGPWAKLDRGMLHGTVHDENAYAFGGVAGHAGLFGTAADLAVLCRTLLNGGAYGPARILTGESVTGMLTAPGLGFGVDQPWFMGELAGRGAAGHTGFTGTSLVLDPATDTFLVLLANTVHPRRRPADNGPRAAAATRLARAARRHWSVTGS
ncbi:serine hydrolase domain-containing protein [Streptomyces sp. H27-D2]|uniref:serine hydrolase domain-containing protein n=1 Tax=Streptomyces sp. H27-D2 TaxID=3046304 RepID=UPI002DBF8FEB|nr:serine hydrolase domain-containing protein [Streptomyces sp. H27-D2]MEC4017810.1 serine hydrolase domain-containing protein [Streptomyces sp. H27-D2]